MAFKAFFVLSHRAGLTKTLRIMRLTAIIVLAASLHVSAKSFSQSITLLEKNVPLEKVLKDIKRQTGFNFLCDVDLLKRAMPVSLAVKDASLSVVLEECFKNQSLSYTVSDKVIVISPKEEKIVEVPSFSLEELAPGDLHGRVMDSTGVPLAGASVTVKGRKAGVQTNIKGEFDLKGVEPGNEIVISYTGFESRTVVVRDEHFIYVNLKVSQNILDETVVQAYGTTSRRFSVGSISTVSADDIGKQPVSNVLMALEGRVPGLLVTQTNGAPGATVLTQIRGQNTLASLPGNSIYDQPLIIVDGVPFAGQNINLATFLNSDFNNVGISALNGLNPASIESVSVLKDADATSIYGSQGSNGVIVITTKKGKAGPTQFHLKVATGPNKITRNLPMMNTQQYLQIRHQALINDQMAATDDPGSFPDLLVWDTTKYTNWMKKWFGGANNNTDVYGSISGGVQNNTFIMGAGYSRYTFNFPGGFADNRFTLHGGLHHNSQDHRLSVDYTNDLNYDRNNSSSSSGVGSALTLAPDLPDLLDPAGKLVWIYKGMDIGPYQILSSLKTPYLVQSFTMNNSLRVAYQIATGLSVSTNLGYSLVYSKQYSASPVAAQDPAYFPTAGADFGTGDHQTFNVEPQMDYRTHIGNGELTALVGATYRKDLSSGNEQDGSGYSDDALLRTISGALTVTNSDSYSITKYAGVFGRLGYVYDRKYILSLSGRRDGSSNFGTDHLFGNFASAGLGWIFSEERGFQKALPFISYAKIAGNYGTTGSDGVAPYQFQPFWKLDNSFTYPAFEGTRPYQPVNLFNPDYGWASKAALNISLDLGFFHDRLLVNATWYRDRTGNQLTKIPLPSQAGGTVANGAGVVGNLNALLQDKGWEISFTSMNIKTKDFRWTSTFNISANHNKLLRFDNLAHSSYASVYEIGKSTNVLYGFRYAGINDTTGAFQFYTAKGNKTSSGLLYGWASTGGDMVPMGNTEPKFYGGFGNTFSYKGFSLSVFMHFNYALTENWLAGVYQGNYPGTLSNLPARMNLSDFWQKTGDAAHVSLQRLVSGSYYYKNPYTSVAMRATSYYGNSTAVYSNNFYIRLQTIALSYTLPPNSLKKLGIKNFSINMNAQNLFVITNYKYGDPETPGSFITVPLQRIITGGVSLDF